MQHERDSTVRGDSDLASSRARRTMLRFAAGAGLLAAAPAAAAGERPSFFDGAVTDRIEIGELIQRERRARDTGLWPEMLSSYHPDAEIDVSWFRGGAAEFVDRTRRMVRPDAINFHQMSPAVVTVRGDRALADTPCALQSFLRLDDVDVNVTGHVHLHWRAARRDGRWLIAGLRPIYVRDLMVSCDPGRTPAIDHARLSTYRISYRHLSYVLAATGAAPRQDLAGTDRPESVAALREGEDHWLAS